jgi:hypothetical protein
MSGSRDVCWQNKAGGWINPTAGLLISDGSRVLEHAKHDRADKGERDIGRHDAQLVDERTQGHHKPPEGQSQWSDFNIRIPSQRAVLRMLKSKGHLKKFIFTGALDLAFALRTRRQVCSECQIRSSGPP